MTEPDLDNVFNYIQGIVQLECWYVSAGRGVGSSFDLALGGKVPRAVPLRNPTAPDEFRENEPEASLLVWCTWRLDGRDSPIASSDLSSDAVRDALQVLIGQKVVSVEATPPAWDLSVTFDSGATLRIFCDHIPPDPTIDSNWELRVRGGELAVGSGYKFELN